MYVKLSLTIHTKFGSVCIYLSLYLFYFIVFIVPCIVLSIVFIVFIVPCMIEIVSSMFRKRDSFARVRVLLFSFCDCPFSSSEDHKLSVVLYGRTVIRLDASFLPGPVITPAGRPPLNDSIFLVPVYYY